MTDKPTPTDAELNTILCAHWPAFASQSTLVKIWVRDALQDAIDKWGQPAQKTVTVVPATGDVWLKHDDDLRYVRRVLEAGRQMTDVDQRAAIDIVQGLRVTARSMAVDAKKPDQAAEPVAVVVPCYTPSGKRVALCSAKQDLPIGTKLYTAPQPVEREPLADWDMRGQLAASLHCWHRLTPNEAAELVAFVQRVSAHGIKGGQHGTE